MDTFSICLCQFNNLKKKNSPVTVLGNGAK